MSSTVTIFGATGYSGVHAVESALEKGYKVRVLVRDESKVPENQKGKVDIVVGDVLNPEDVAKSLETSDRVIVVLGTRNNIEPTTVMSTGLKNILNAMREKEIRLVSVCLSAFLFFPQNKIPPMFHNVDSDHRRMETLLNDYPDLDWIAIMPTHIVDGGISEILTSNGVYPGSRKISKENLGQFLVDVLEMPEFIHKRVGLCNKPKEDDHSI